MNCSCRKTHLASVIAMAALSCIAGCRRSRAHADVVLAPLPASAIPGDGLAERVAARIRTTYPDVRVQVANPTTLSIAWTDAEASTLSLENLHRLCTIDPASCDPSIDRFVRSMNEVFHPPPVDPANLRAVVRDRRFFEQAAAQPSGAGTTQPLTLLSRPLVGDLFVGYVLDMPDSMSFATTRTLQSLALTPDALHARAMTNSAAAFADLPHEPIAEGARVWRVRTGDSYESSRFLFPALWEPIRREVRGDLLASVPMRDAILFTGSSEPGGLDQLRAETARLESQGDHPISQSIFRWTPGGWALFASAPRE